MKTRARNIFIALALLALSTLDLQLSSAHAQGTAFAYQGQLQNKGGLASGTYNFTFTLFETNITGVAIAGPATNNAVIVTNGLFTVTIDFGPGVFMGTKYWLQIGVESNGASVFTTLAPRQELTPVPYAIFGETASNLLGTLSAAQLTSIGNTNGGGYNANFFVGPSGNSTTTGAGNTADGVDALADNTSGFDNTADGYAALILNTTGINNTADGTGALFENTSGSENTAEGANALFHNTIGSDNTANGALALYNNTTGSNNVANGYQALQDNASGFDNTANGYFALNGNTIGSYNTANGAFALWLNTIGGNNTADGYGALIDNASGNQNTAVGDAALAQNTTGSNNVADGYGALASLPAGNDNTAIGWGALPGIAGTGMNNNTAVGQNAIYQLNTGINNTAVGSSAGGNQSGNGNTALGVNAFGGMNDQGNSVNRNTAVGIDTLDTLISGNDNISLGSYAGQNVEFGSSNIDIGSYGQTSDNNTIRVGIQGIQNLTVVAGIYGTTLPQGATPVLVDSSGRLGTMTSSRRFKEDVKNMAEVSDAIYSLRPVTFKYKPDIDPKGAPEYGLIAEEVAQVNPDLVVRDGNNRIYTVRYDAVNVMLLNEFLKEHRTVEQEKNEIESLKQQNDSLDQRLNELEATVKQLAGQK